MRFHFIYNLDDNDYFTFNKYHYENSNIFKKSIFWARLIIAFVFVLFMLYLVLEYPGDNALLLVLGLLLAVVYVISFFVTKPYLRHSQMKNITRNMQRMKKSGKLPYPKSVNLYFDEERICEMTEFGDSRFNYTMLEKIAVSNLAVYIYYGAVQAFIIPLSAFIDEQQKTEFLAFIHEKTAGERSSPGVI